MRARLIPVAALILALPGCAVLTIDVDVYKGALANHESVQTEQVAAMAMGAKPLLAELRYKLERGACFQKLPPTHPIDDDNPAIRDTCPGYLQTRSRADFVSPILLLGRDAQRVNEILYLYEDVTSPILRPVEEALIRLITRIEEGKRIVVPYIQGGGKDRREVVNRAEALAVRAREAQEFQIRPKDAFGVPEPERSRVVAVRSVWEAASDAWLEAVRILSSGELRKRLKESRDDAIWDVAWVAADLTSGEGLRRFLTDRGTPATLKTGPLAKLGELLPVLTDPAKTLTGDAEDAVGAVLAQMLAEEATGPALAKQLTMAQGYAGIRPERDWFIVIHPTKETIIGADTSLETTREDTRGLLRAPAHGVGIGLGAGRPDKGLEKLIDEYLKAPRTDGSGADEKRRLRELLFDALVNFAEKVVVIANFDPLVRGKESGYQQQDTNRYIRVLQAVGNSILSQVDALKQSAAQQQGLSGTRDIELAGLRSAEARAAAVLKEITTELTAKPASFPDKAAILTALAAGQQTLDQLVNQLGQTLTSERAALEPERADAAKWATADTVVGRKDVQDAIDSYAKTTPAATTADVASRLVQVLGEWEALARLPGGAGADEARRLQTTAGVLGDARFTGDTANPGAAKDKYHGTVREIGRERDATRDRERPRAANIAALERWHRQVTVMSTQAKPRLAIPERIEKGKASKASEDGQKPTAKDVLDVMLATLRYEHINAMRDHGPDNQITRNLAAAVELNFAYRSGMVHILPASAYLRNSYPASILQQDPSVGLWRNMLTDHAEHQLPFYEWFQRWWHKDEIDVNKAIDKQFWQSVNQVRVSGVGLTNYAIAKDDIGNWYVKSYSSDPKDIIQSAKNLAMFSAGSALGANFLARGAQPSGTEAPTTKEARSTLGKQFDRVSKRYEEQTLTSRKNLKEEIEGLNGRLSRTVSDRVGGDAKRVEDAKVFTPLSGKTIEDLGQDKGTDGKSKPVSKLNAEIAAALRAVKRYRNDVQARVTTMTVAQGQTPAANQLSTEAGTQAKQAVDATVREFLERATKERQTATGQYESGLLLIGESAGL